MKRSKLLSAVLLTLCTSVIFTGCGNQNSGNQNNETQNSDTQNSDADQIISNMKFFTPEKWEGTEEGADVSFETIDLDGNTVNSKDLFAQNKVTMINIWGTTCGPCVNEMPVLEQMNKEFQARGGAVVGLVDDVRVNDQQYLEDAKSIVKDTGVTYLNLCSWDGFDEMLACIGTPTTYFVDSHGKLLGEPVLGAYPEKYKEFMEEYLSKAE